MTHEEPARLEPAHVIMLRAALLTHPCSSCVDGTYHTHRLQSDVDVDSRHLARWRRITAPVLDLAETCKLPLGLVLLALGKGV